MYYYKAILIEAQAKDPGTTTETSRGIGNSSVWNGVLTGFSPNPVLTFITEWKPPVKIDDNDLWDVIGSQVLLKAEGIQAFSEHLGDPVGSADLYSLFTSSHIPS